MTKLPPIVTTTVAMLSFNLALALWVFRSLFTNAATHLLDARDYPYYAWTVFQNVERLGSLKLDGYFNANIYYPFQSTLLFSDLLLPQSLVAVPLAAVLSNTIAMFNVVFLVTLSLNLVTIWWFWKQLVPRPWLLLLATTTTFLSPYFFSQVDHFQMVSFWPFFAGMALMMSQKKNWWIPVVTGLLITVQLLASIYLSLFMLTSIGLWYALKLWYQRRQPLELKKLLLYGSLTAIAFAATAGPIIAAYLNVRNVYNIERDAGEFVTYAAQPSDVLFYSPQSLAGQSQVGKTLQRFNNHVVGEIAATPGIALGGLAVLGLFSLRNRRQEVALSFPTNFNHVYFGSLLVIGFVFALGTRLTINGAYTAIPLPYLLVIKLIPILEPIRSTGRWLFLGYLALSYFAVQGLAKLKSERKQLGWILPIAVLLIYTVEVIPVRRPAMEVASIYSEYALLQRTCQNQPGVLLEYPLNQDVAGANIVTNLRYKTGIMLASLQHDCQLVNGYSGYEPTGHAAHENELNRAVLSGDAAAFWQLLSQRDIRYLRLNKLDLLPQKVATIEAWLADRPEVTALHRGQEYTIVKLPPNDVDNVDAPGS